MIVGSSIIALENTASVIFFHFHFKKHKSDGSKKIKLFTRYEFILTPSKNLAFFVVRMFVILSAHVFHL